MTEQLAVHPDLNPDKGMRFNGRLDIATVKEIAMFAADLAIGTPTATSHSFSAEGSLYGVTTSMELHAITADPVEATITLSYFDDLNIMRDKYNPRYIAAVKIGGAASCDFNTFQPFTKYQSAVANMARSGYILVNHVEDMERVTSNFILKLAC